MAHYLENMHRQRQPLSRLAQMLLPEGVSDLSDTEFKHAVEVLGKWPTEGSCLLFFLLP